MLEEEKNADKGLEEENEEDSSSFKGRIIWILFFAVLVALAIACVVVIKALDQN